MLIQEKAKSLYEDLKKKHGEESEGASFNAFHGWFHRFKARANLHNVKLSGEAASADRVAAQDEESKEIFSNLVTLSKKLELDLQEDDFTELLAVQHKELTNEDLMELEAQRKDEERQEEEEVTEELKRFTTQEMARGFSLCEEALLVFEAQDPNVEQYTKVAAAVQNAIQ